MIMVQVIFILTFVSTKLFFFDILDACFMLIQLLQKIRNVGTLTWHANIETAGLFSSCPTKKEKQN